MNKQNMTKREIIKIFFLALIAGSIMDIVIVEIFGTLDLTKLIQLEICVILIIIFLFIASKLWDRKLRRQCTTTGSVEKK